MSYATARPRQMLLWTVYQPNRELSHLVVLPKSTSEFVADAVTCPHVDSRAGVTKNLPLFKLASVLVPLDHVSSCMLFQAERTLPLTSFPRGGRMRPALCNLIARRTSFSRL